MSKIRILIVEDEPVMAAYLLDELTDQGFMITGTAESAERAVKLAKETTPDLVLMDINLSGSTDGIEAAFAMNQVNIPVIFLTAHYDRQTIDRAKGAAPVGYLTKPFEPIQLSIAIEVGLERHRSQAELARLVRELEVERQQVKTLSGLLPICYCCKKIRDDNDYWETLEAYISRHSTASFSHSLCPSCMAEALAKVGESAAAD